MSLASPDSHKSYRPLTIISFRINYWLHGLHPFGYHMTNVLLHCTVCVLLLYITGLLVGRREGDREVQWITTLLFAVHPIHTEAVSVNILYICVM